jgi:hypothetical protein
MKRIKLLPVDITAPLGISQRHARNVFKNMRVYYKKERHQIITLKEFCEYEDLKDPKIIDMIASQMS